MQTRMQKLIESYGGSTAFTKAVNDRLMPHNEYVSRRTVEEWKSGRSSPSSYWAVILGEWMEGEV